MRPFGAVCAACSVSRMMSLPLARAESLAGRALFFTSARLGRSVERRADSRRVLFGGRWSRGVLVTDGRLPQLRLLTSVASKVKVRNKATSRSPFGTFCVFRRSATYR